MAAATSFARELPITKAILGKNVIVEWRIRSQEDLIIEGEGTIDMIEHRLTIAPNGKVRADVKVSGMPITSRTGTKRYACHGEQSND